MNTAVPFEISISAPLIDAVRYTVPLSSVADAVISICCPSIIASGILLTSSLGAVTSASVTVIILLQIDLFPAASDKVITNVYLPASVGINLS